MKPHRRRFISLMAASVLFAGSQACGQVVINEVLVRNKSVIRNTIGYEAYVELYNMSTSVVALASWSLTDSLSVPGKYTFPEAATIPANGYIIVWCDQASSEPGLHAPFKLKNSGDDIALFQGTNLVDYVVFGLQAPDLCICRMPGGAGIWQGGTPTPGSNNQAMLMGSPTSLRINEWMAASSETEDWIELYNPGTNRPVVLTDLIIVDSTNASVVSMARPIPALSFINSNSFVRFWADDLTGKAADHLGFKLSKSGESIALFAVGGTVLLDHVTFGPQTTDCSMGFLPDGGTNMVQFPTGSSSPEFSNYRPVTNVIISELLAHTDPPLEDALELYNPTPLPVDISYWWLSDDQGQPQKYRIPYGTIIAPYGYKVMYEYISWNRNRTGTFPEFTFSAANGGEVVLSSGDSLGRLTGLRVIQEFGASKNGVSFGRHITSDGTVEFVAMPDLSFGSPVRASSPDTPQNRALFESGPGAVNPYPMVGPIVISEIMFRPPELLIDTNLVDNDIEEYIELHNLASNTVPLFDLLHPTNTWRLRDGVDFDFPQGTVVPGGGYLVVVPFDPVLNPALLAGFCSRYHVSSNATILGPYDGKLANGGEVIELRKPDNPDATEVPYVLVERVKYQQADPWPTGADGSGFSLHRINLTMYGNDPANWVADWPTVSAERPAVAINEILAQADPQSRAGIEIANLSGSPMDISYWWLSNDRTNPQKYRIPADTILAPGSYTIIYESDFNPSGSGLAPEFTLNSPLGGEVALTGSDSNGNLTGISQIEHYGPPERGISEGRHLKNTGIYDWAQMSAISLGFSNAAPRTGPVVISEIMFHPSDLLVYSNLVAVPTNNTADEYIELQNISSNLVPLYSTANHVPLQYTNTWRISGEVQFNFPLFVSLLPGSRILVVNFDPTANPSQQIDFRLKYDIPSNVRLFGPLIGSLNNRSGTVELLKPGPVEVPPKANAGFVPYTRIDSVSYEDRQPWPTNTDGTGFSLQRISPTSYGNEPTNWYGAAQTGGRSPQLAAHVTAQPPPHVLLAAGSNLILTVDAEGFSPMHYQWLFNGMPLENQATNRLVLVAVQAVNQGDYQLVVSNAFGTETSSVARLELALRPTVITNLQNAIVMQGEPLVFSATVSGTPPFGFVWRKSATLVASQISSDNESTYAVPFALLLDAGYYQLKITNLASATGVSTLCRVCVVEPLGSRTAVAGSDLVITANAAVYGNWYYRWQFAGNFIIGATNDSLVLTNVQPEQAGTYRLWIGDDSSFTGTVRSVECQLAVQSLAYAPQFVRHPQSQRVSLGSRALLVPEVAGTEPLSFQWWFNQTNRLASGTNRFLEFSAVAAQSLGTYTLVVSNQAGQMTSQECRLIASDDASMAPSLAGVGLISGQMTVFSFGTKPGFTYQVQFKNALNDAAWSPLGNRYIGDGNPVQIAEPVVSTVQRFYRVLVLP